jgi:hypothetical protein
MYVGVFKRLKTSRVRAELALYLTTTGVSPGASHEFSLL